MTLLAAALEKHGAPGIGLLLRLIEVEAVPEDLCINAWLERIGTLSATDLTMVLAVIGARR